MIEWMILLVAASGAFAAFIVLTIALRAAWHHHWLSRDFPRAMWRRRKRQRGAVKRPVSLDVERGD